MWRKPLPRVQRYMGAVLYVLIFFYMSIASTCLNYLRCQDVAGSYVNYSAPIIQCDSAQYKSFSVLIYFIFISYTVLFPIATFAFLYWNWKQSKLDDVHFSTNYGALYKAYKPHFFWWEDIVLLRRIVIVTVFVFVSENVTHKQVCIALSTSTNQADYFQLGQYNSAFWTPVFLTISQ